MKWQRVRFLSKSIRLRLTRERPWAIFAVMIFFIAVVASMWSLKVEFTDGPQRYLKTLNVSHWIVQPGGDSLSVSSSVNPQVLTDLQGAGYLADGTVAWFNTINDVQGMYLSYQPGGILDPQLKSGRQVNDINEVVLDQVLAESLDVDVGDTVTLVNDDFTVVGLSRETNSVGKESAFINHEAMTRLTGQPTYQAIAVQLQPDQAWPPPVNLEGYEVTTHPSFIASNLQYQEETINPFIYVIIAIAFIGVGGMLMLLFNRTIKARLQEIAIFKSCGDTGNFSVTVEFMAMMILLVSATVVGGLVASALVFGVSFAIEGVTPSISINDLLLGLGFGFALCVLGFIFPYRRIMRLRPVELLRSTM